MPPLPSSKNEDGFTLIELMVVVLIIAILLAIAVPTFLGARTRANNRAAQSALRTALTAAKATYVDTQNYLLTTPAGLAAIEPSLTFEAADVGSSGPTSVSIDPALDGAGTTMLVASVKSKSGACYYIKDVPTKGNASNVGGTTYGKYYGANPASCRADHFRVGVPVFFYAGPEVAGW